MAAPKYEKLTQLEHVLLRPDTYVGACSVGTEPRFVRVDGAFVKRPVANFSPALYSVFGEAAANAFDHTNRPGLAKPVTKIWFTVDAAAGTIAVRNDGDGIPVAMHPKEHVWNPELIFGHLLTSSNYDDTEKRVTGGRNGYGIKLVNIFAREFHVETLDVESGKKYTQTWRDNMSVMEPPVIKSSALKTPYTEVRWVPDLARLGYGGASPPKTPHSGPSSPLPEDMVACFERRAYEVAACVRRGVKVYWNGELVEVKGFEAFARMHLPADAPVVDVVLNERWHVAVADSPATKLLQVSFVNGLPTADGGTHVNAIVSQLTKYLVEAINKKAGRTADAGGVTDTMVENRLAVFVNCLIENPTFSSQTKEKMTLPRKVFGSDCTLPDKFLKAALAKLGMYARLTDALSAKDDREAKKTDGGRRGKVFHPKLVDANWAGDKKRSAECTLILCEGDSAQNMLRAGLKGPGCADKYGHFPLRGKPLNPDEVDNTKVHTNAEIAALKQILGLETGKEYASVAGLRYGKVLIMTDQDHDGTHIRGLILNIFHELWPSLLKIEGFLSYMPTPILKASKGKRVQPFYTHQAYDAWCAATKDAATWKIKYYKGLGSTSNAEAPEYFSHPAIPFKAVTEGDVRSLELAFKKGASDLRKEWMGEWDPMVALSHEFGRAVSVSDYVHRDYIHFAEYSLRRAIPSLLDGLKEAQRKLLHFLLGHNSRTTVKVAQLAARVADEAHYHHGEKSMEDTIVHMAQSFVGSNNVPLLEADGQFGSRMNPVAAAGRYIHTRLEPVALALFPKSDIPVLRPQVDEGDAIEPEWLCGVLPMVLVNGAAGIATGFSTEIPCFSAAELKEYLLGRLAGGPRPAAWNPVPWYRGFNGTIVAGPKANQFTTSGVLSQVSPTEFRVSELPVGVSGQAFKEHLMKLVDSGVLVDVRDHTTDVDMVFDVAFAAPPENPVKVLGLTKTLSLNNMHLLDASGTIRRYETVQDIVEAYYEVRLDLYDKRRAWMLADLDRQVPEHEAIMTFLQAQLDGRLDLRNRAHEAVAADLAGLGIGAEHHDRLLGMAFRSITREELAKHREKLAAIRAERATLAGKAPATLWVEELQALDF